MSSPQPRPSASAPPVAAPSLCAAFQATAAAHPEWPALREFGAESALSWRDYAVRVEAIAGGLATLEVGRGTTVALILSHRPEAHLIDAAGLHLGAVPFSLDHQAPPEQTAYLLENSDATVVVTERALLPAAKAAIGKGTTVEHVILVDGDPNCGEDGCHLLTELEGSAPADFDFDAAWRAVGSEDLATIVYTSGSTGVPKGVQMPHRVMMSSLRGVHQVAPPTLGSRVLAYLPMAHIAERFWSHYAAMAFGFEIVSVAPPSQLQAALVQERPDRFFAVPRTYEKLAAVARRLLDEGRDLPEIRSELGLDRAEWLGVATAPSSPGVLALFSEVGLPVSDMYGLTEAVMATLSPPGASRPGTVGRPLPEVELRIASDGELLIRGPSLFSAYRKDPVRTAEMLDADGWVHSGDLARLDADGYCSIIGRKKEIMITSGGKNLAPSAIEAALRDSSSLIAYAAVIADGRKYVTALVALDPDELKDLAARHGLTGSFAELVRSPAVLAEVGRAVSVANDSLGHVEQIKRHQVMAAPWVPGGEEVTSTLKLRRSSIEAKFREVVDELYAEAQ